MASANSSVKYDETSTSSGISPASVKASAICCSESITSWSIGTGVTGRDVTPEALAAVVEKDIPGFGEMFRMISYAKIGTSALQSRACAGVADGTYLFCLPGSPGACRDGWDEILRWQLDIRHRPCNFAELLPRLRER